MKYQIYIYTTPIYSDEISNISILRQYIVMKYQIYIYTTPVYSDEISNIYL